MVIERLDRAETEIMITVAGRFVDFAQGENALAPGGLYLVRAGGRSVVFKVDPLAQPGTGPVVGRLLKL